MSWWGNAYNSTQPFARERKRNLLGFLNWLPPLGPIGGTLISSALQAIFGIGATIAANKYNSPKSQLKRLRKAGLPQAYMYQGRINQQSDIPKLSIDPQLGVLQKSQKRLIDTKQEDLGMDIQVKDIIGEGSNKTNRLRIKEAEVAEAEAVGMIKKHEERLKQIQRLVENTLFSEGVPQDQRRKALEKVKQELKNLVKQEGLMTQLGEIREFDAWLNDTFSDNIKSLPEWAQALTSFFLKISRGK